MEDTSTKHRPPPRSRTSPLRSDGQFTREQLLNTAGQVFAECGYERTTSKLICERANANAAAVNYHFGGKDGLYEAVLAEAHRQLVDADELAAWASGPGDPRERLALVLRQVLRLTSQNKGWAFPVLLREMLSPSPLLPALALKTVRPKARILIGLISEILGLPPEHPSLHRCVFMCIVPCMLTAIAPPALTANVLPSLANDTEAFASDLITFALAGIEAVGAQASMPA